MELEKSVSKVVDFGETAETENALKSSGIFQRAAQLFQAKKRDSSDEDFEMDKAFQIYKFGYDMNMVEDDMDDEDDWK